jgi:hypothetical protein
MRCKSENSIVQVRNPLSQVWCRREKRFQDNPKRNSRVEKQRIVIARMKLIRGKMHYFFYNFLCANVCCSGVVQPWSPEPFDYEPRTRRPAHIKCTVQSPVREVSERHVSSSALFTEKTHQVICHQRDGDWKRRRACCRGYWVSCDRNKLRERASSYILQDGRTVKIALN